MVPVEPPLLHGTCIHIPGTRYGTYRTCVYHVPQTTAVHTVVYPIPLFVDDPRAAAVLLCTATVHAIPAADYVLYSDLYVANTRTVVGWLTFCVSKCCCLYGSIPYEYNIILHGGILRSYEGARLCSTYYIYVLVYRKKRETRHKLNY